MDLIIIHHTYNTRPVLGHHHHSSVLHAPCLECAVVSPALPLPAAEFARWTVRWLPGAWLLVLEILVNRESGGMPGGGRMGGRRQANRQGRRQAALSADGGGVAGRSWLARQKSGRLISKPTRRCPKNEKQHTHATETKVKKKGRWWLLPRISFYP